MNLEGEEIVSAVENNLNFIYVLFMNSLLSVIDDSLLFSNWYCHLYYNSNGDKNNI